MPISRLFSRVACPISLVLASGLSACGPQPEPAQNRDAGPPAAERPALPRPQPPLDRPALLAAVAEAASASAAGLPIPKRIASLDGKQFEFRIRFGCRGPARELQKAWLGWSFDPEERILRVRAKPTISKQDPPIAEMAGAEHESVEGFWIPRPWLLQPVCPAMAAVNRTDPEDADSADGPAEDEESAQTAADPVPAAPRIGIAQFFTVQDARTHRRGPRPYSAVKTIPEGTPLSSQGFDLVLSGRLRALGDRGVIQCIAKSAEAPPECVVSAEFLRVRIERPDSGEMVAEWGGV
jgi:hypothetical protein